MGGGASKGAKRNGEGDAEAGAHPAQSDEAAKRVHAAELAPAATAKAAAIAPDESTAWGKQFVLREAWAKNDAAFRAWLALADEEAVLEPELEIIDPHHHLWDMRSLKGFNLFGLFRQQYYTVEEFAEDLLSSGHRVTRTVYAEAHAFGGGMAEAQFAQGVAAQFSSGNFGELRACAGIIGGCDLTVATEDVKARLQAMQAACPNLRGIRVNGQVDEKLKDGFKVKAPGLYRDEKFRAGFEVLGELSLSFDAFVYSSQLADVQDLASAFPNTTIILNHIGVPACALGDFGEHAPEYAGKQTEIVDAWKQKMTEIAEKCPNVSVKLGGFMGCLGHGWAARTKPVNSKQIADAVGPLLKFVVQTFGASRCMFEGNFPVDKCNCSYRTLWNAFKLLARDAELALADADVALLFAGTAKKVYQLE